jgi:ubiquinone/menaquinone biosynthesis C-methylase UbiE
MLVQLNAAARLMAFERPAPALHRDREDELHRRLADLLLRAELARGVNGEIQDAAKDRIGAPTMQLVDYNEISKIYDDVREGDVILINHFLQEIPYHDASNVLDIGCGTGNYTDLFQKLTQAKGHRVYGIDPSEGMLNKARRKNTLIVFQQGTATHIPSEDNFFDFAFMTDVIHHIPDIRKMFIEIYRVLRSQGKVCIVTQSHRQIEARPIVRFFPGTANLDKKRYPDIHEIIAAGQFGCLRYLKQEILFKDEPIELGAGYLELIQKKGYSMLHLLPEHDYQIGLNNLEIALQNGPVQARSAGETLIWFMKESIPSQSA